MNTFNNELVANLVELVKAGNQVYLTDDGLKELVKILSVEEYDHISSTFAEKVAEAI